MAPTGSGPCLTFTVAGCGLAARLARIREIVRPRAITQVPATPPWIRGVTSLRDTLVPVVDLAVKLGRETLRESGQYHAFGLPILYLQSYKGMILPELSEPKPADINLRDYS